MSEGPLSGQVVVVTGGARGIGRAIAAAAGARVALVDLLDTAAPAAALSEATGRTPPTDVTDPASVAAAYVMGQDLVVDDGYTAL